MTLAAMDVGSAGLLAATSWLGDPIPGAWAVYAGLCYSERSTICFQTFEVPASNVNDGRWRTLIAVPFHIVPGSPYRLELQRDGRSFRALIDGELMMRYPEDSFLQECAAPWQWFERSANGTKRVRVRTDDCGALPSVAVLASPMSAESRATVMALPRTI